jgi:hypothetical protein
MPGVHIETIHNPRRYTCAQIDRSMRDRAEARPRQAALVEPLMTWSM